MLVAIHVDACSSDRDELPEVDLFVMVQRGVYFDSKNRLHNNYCNIPLVVPATEHNQLELIMKILGAIIDL